MLITSTLIIVILLLILTGVALVKIHRLNQTKVFKWQIGNHTFTWQFPGGLKRYFPYYGNFLTKLLVCFGIIFLGIIGLIAVVSFLFLFLGLLIPVLVIIGLIVLILFLIFEI